MKKLITIAALISAAFAAPLAQAGAVYNYSYAFGNGVLVEGSFTGTANGNLVSNLSNISASINGVAYNGSGNLFASSMQKVNGYYGAYYTWVSGGGVASFDGLQNNFLFIDVDYPNSYSYTNYFYDVSNPSRQVYASGKGLYGNDYSYNYNYYSQNYTKGVWTLTAANAASDVPEPTSVLLMGLGLVGLVAARRKKNA
jgi:hypothetical protein